MAIDVEAYYKDFGPMVLRRCRALLKNEEAAVDAMQDTFVKLLKNQDKLSNDAPSSLLYRMATNTCLNKIRSSKVRKEDSQSTILEHIAGFQESEPRLMARSLLGGLFSKHKESTRTMAVMHLLDKMTLEEVAAQVGMSVSGVRKRLRPLKQELQKLEGEMV